MANLDRGLYRKFLEEFVREAIAQSDGTNAGIRDYLRNIPQASGLLARHKAEKSLALADALNAFEEHRHWPVHMVLAHLGIE
jgi:hypothetical protein